MRDDETAPFLLVIVSNVLLNAVNERLPQHSVAVNWLAEAYAGPTGLGFAWVALLGFVRLATRQGVLEKPLPVDEALRLVHDCLAHPRARILHPTERHEPLLGRLLRTAGTAGNLTNDAHLAALAIEHGATLVSFDRDFERFAGLRFERLRA